MLSLASLIADCLVDVACLDAADAMSIANVTCQELGLEAVIQLNDDILRAAVERLTPRVIDHVGKGDAEELAEELSNELANKLRAPPDEHPRLSVKRKDAAGCEAVVIPLVRKADGTLCEDFDQAPELVPLALLGCKVAVEQITAGDCRTGATFRMGAPVEGHGGPQLHGMALSSSTFAAAEMVAGGDVDFEAMKVAQLKAELAERGSTRTGLKAVLQRRLHALIVQAVREDQTDEMHTDP